MSDAQSVKHPSSPLPRGEASLDPQGRLLSFFRAIPRGFDVFSIGKSSKDRSIKEARVCGQYRTPPASRGGYRLSASQLGLLADCLLRRTCFVLKTLAYIYVLPAFLPFLPPLHFSDSLWVPSYLPTHFGKSLV